MSTIYRLGSVPRTTTFLEEIIAFVELLAMFYTQLTIAGDVNLHLHEVDDVNTERFNAILLNTSLADTQPSHLAKIKKQSSGIVPFRLLVPRRETRCRTILGHRRLSAFFKTHYKLICSSSAPALNIVQHPSL